MSGAVTEDESRYWQLHVDEAIAEQERRLARWLAGHGLTLKPPPSETPPPTVKRTTRFRIMRLMPNGYCRELLVLKSLSKALAFTRRSRFHRNGRVWIDDPGKAAWTKKRHRP